ncbi:hypothetical protein [Bacillus sp. 1P06AnD]|uniref:hypothetical protein n=1 Tax=Bacillus sp. 1P06AnD TaxID=3132208 RepID=UPI00399FD31E
MEVNSAKINKEIQIAKKLEDLKSLIDISVADRKFLSKINSAIPSIESILNTVKAELQEWNHE